MYQRLIKGHLYWYKSVRHGDKVTGTYVGPVHSLSYSRHPGRSLATLETYNPPKKFSNARKIYEHHIGRPFPIKKVITDKNGKILDKKYNAAVDVKSKTAIVSGRMPKPEKTKALLEEALHISPGLGEGPTKRHGKKLPGAEITAISLMHHSWPGLPLNELNRLRGRDDQGKIIKY